MRRKIIKLVPGKSCGDAAKFFSGFFMTKKCPFFGPRKISEKRLFWITKKKGHIHLNSFSFLQNLFISHKYTLMASDNEFKSNTVGTSQRRLYY